ncbi:MAG: homoserine kinase [Elusimicrobia bacterium CG1_02_37_114]|nr:MAG: homoserine kinase [Elusimicrobia bacterium CG1_02_37_114]
MKKIKVKIPATTGNLGSGFDVVGAALKLYNTIEVQPDNKKLVIDIKGEGENNLPRDRRNIVYQAMEKVFRKTGCPPATGYRIRLINNIPVARGLGSSASAIIGGLVCANKLCGDKLSKDEIIKIATELEGHPDNVIPALLGGLCISYKQKDTGKIRYVRLDLPTGLVAVLCIPEFELSTEKARKILPKKISMSDAVFNCSRVALLINALTKKKYELLSVAMEDKLHQPYRAKLIGGMDNVFRTAVESGAFGAALSGAGPAILAFVSPGKAKRVGQEMVRVWRKNRVSSKYAILGFDNVGAQISKN